MALTVEWIDGGRTAKNPPDPKHPNGIDFDIAGETVKSCRIALPYPAPRCGQHAIKCTTCGWSGLITAAGRADDPRSIRVACIVPKGN